MSASVTQVEMPLSRPGRRTGMAGERHLAEYGLTPRSRGSTVLRNARAERKLSRAAPSAARGDQERVAAGARRAHAVTSVSW